MKYNLLKGLFILFFSLNVIIVNAQEAADADAPENVAESGTVDDDDVPINNGLLWLGVAGIAFGLYYFSTQRKKQIN